MKKHKVIIVHGTLGAPTGNWFPWLQSQLEKENIEVACPKLPTPDGQNFTSWKDVFARELDRPKDEIVLVGHSIGASFVIRMAEETTTTYRALFPVCPFDKTLGIEGYDALNASFVEHSFDWDKIRKGALHKCCFAGDNDPYVPLSTAEEVAKAMAAEFIVIANGGHLNTESGYTDFPQLLSHMRTVL